MDRRLVKSLASGVALSLVLLTGVDQALAHDKQGPPAPVKGLVTALDATNNGSIQIQTSSSSVTLGLTSNTRVIRAVSGSLADVGINDHIDAYLIQGTNTIRSIHLDETTKPKARPEKRDHPAVPNRTPAHSKPVLHQPTGEISGQVQSINDNTITIRKQHNQITTYTLSNSVTVTKLMNGNFGNLAIGETVVAQKTQSGTAASIMIMNA